MCSLNDKQHVLYEDESSKRKRHYGSTGLCCHLVVRHRTRKAGRVSYWLLKDDAKRVNEEMKPA